MHMECDNIENYGYLEGGYNSIGIPGGYCDVEDYNYKADTDRGFNFNDFRWCNAASGARWCILSIDSYFTII